MAFDSICSISFSFPLLLSPPSSSLLLSYLPSSLSEVKHFPNPTTRKGHRYQTTNLAAIHCFPLDASNVRPSLPPSLPKKCWVLLAKSPRPLSCVWVSYFLSICLSPYHIFYLQCYVHPSSVPISSSCPPSPSSSPSPFPLLLLLLLWLLARALPREEGSS